MLQWKAFTLPSCKLNISNVQLNLLLDLELELEWNQKFTGYNDSHLLLFDLGSGSAMSHSHQPARRPTDGW